MFHKHIIYILLSHIHIQQYFHYAIYFFVYVFLSSQNWPKKLTANRKIPKALTVSRKSHHPIETLVVSPLLIYKDTLNA